MQIQKIYNLRLSYRTYTNISWSLLAVWGLLLTAYSLPAQAAVSATFQVRDDQIGITGFHQTSPNYTVDGTVEAIVGSQDSPGFGTQTGTPILIPQSSTPTPSTTGGSSVSSDCAAPTNFSVTSINCNRAYKSLIKLSGTRDKNTPFILVNGELAGTYLPSPTRWEKDVYLKLGENTIVIYGKNFCDATTPPVTIILNRSRMGDINEDSKTNDYDLSNFTRRWERKKDCPTDFNVDGITDDYDLSLLASSWTN